MKVKSGKWKGMVSAAPTDLMLEDVVPNFPFSTFNFQFTQKGSGYPLPFCDYVVAAAFRGRMGAKVEMACL